ncbi:MAG: nickel-dependent lactate racemase [Gammaproteobacteria bacterium]|nr:nickel-dependent lactate racemase [Gammaproteobacteria bacterium]
MEIELRYGRGGLKVRLPEDCEPTVIEKPPMPVVADPAAAIAGALDAPVACAPLPELAAGKRSACILVCDITRPVPNGLFLRPLIERLHAAGIPREAITVLVATGLHRPNLGEELAEVVGDPWVLENVRVENHYARRDEDHVGLGHTRGGTVVRLNRRLVEADLRIATGLVEPHFMAGYSGGRKVIAPGVAHAETITTFHNHRFMSHPLSANCVLAGNPLHEEQVEIVAMIGGALALNTVIDDQRRLSFVNFGEVLASHGEAVEYVRRYAEVRLPHRFKTVLTSAAGYPLDKTYYQTVKGMVGPMDILDDDGDLIVASECSEGFGSAEFADAQRRYVAMGREGFLADIAAKRHADIDEWQTQMQAKPQERLRITLYSSGLGEAERALTGVTMTDSVEAAVAESLARHGDRRIAVVPEGPYVIPCAD